MFAADAGVGVWMAAMTIDTVVVRRLVLVGALVLPSSLLEPFIDRTTQCSNHSAESP
jgi:hypothetical protein